MLNMRLLKPTNAIRRTLIYLMGGILFCLSASMICQTGWDRTAMIFLAVSALHFVAPVTKYAYPLVSIEYFLAGIALSSFAFFHSAQWLLSPDWRMVMGLAPGIAAFTACAAAASLVVTEPGVEAPASSSTAQGIPAHQNRG